MNNTIKNIECSAKKTSKATCILVSLLLLFYLNSSIQAKSAIHPLEMNGFYFSMSLGGAYLSGIPSNTDYVYNVSPLDSPLINPFPFGDSHEVLDERITDTPYGYKVNLAIGYSHLFWGIRPEIEFAFLSNAGLFDKKEICQK